MATEVQISESVLRGANLPVTARNAGDNKLDAEDLARVKAEAAAELADLKKMLEDTAHPYHDTISQNMTADGKAALSKLLNEVQSGSVSSPALAANTPAPRSTVALGAPTDIAPILTSIKGNLDVALPDDAQYLSKLRAILSVVPGLEVSSNSDIKDILFQKRSYTEKYLDWLTREYSKNDGKYPIKMSFSSWLLESKSGKPGWYPGFPSDDVIVNSFTEKQALITKALQDINKHWENAKKDITFPDKAADFLLSWDGLSWVAGATVVIIAGKAIKGNKYTSGIADVAGSAAHGAANLAKGAGGLALQAAKKTPGIINNVTYGRGAAPTITPEKFAEQIAGLRNSIIESIVTNRNVLSNNRPGAVVDLPAHPTQVEYRNAETAIRNNPILRSELESRLNQLSRLQADINAGNVRMTEPQFKALLGDIVRGKKFAMRDLNPLKGAGLVGNTYELVERAGSTVKRKAGSTAAAARVDDTRIHDATHAAQAYAQLHEQIGAAADLPAADWQAFEDRIARNTSSMEDQMRQIEALEKELAEAKEKRESVSNHNEAIRQATEARDAEQRRYDAEYARIHTAADALSSQVATARTIRDGHQNTVNTLDADMADLTAKIQAIKDTTLVASEVPGVADIDTAIQDIDAKIKKEEAKITRAKDPSLVASEVPGVADIDTAIQDIDAKIKKEEAKITRAKDPSLVASEVPGVADIDAAIAKIDGELSSALDKTDLNNQRTLKIQEKAQFVSKYIQGIEGIGGSLEPLAKEKAGRTAQRSTLISRYIGDANTALDGLGTDRKAKIQERDRLIAPERVKLEGELATKKLQKSQAQLPLTEASGKLTGLEESLRQSQTRLATLETTLHTAQDTLTAKGTPKTAPRDRTAIEAELRTAHTEMERLVGESNRITSDLGARTTRAFTPNTYSARGGLFIGGERIEPGSYHTKFQGYVRAALKAGTRH